MNNTLCDVSKHSGFLLIFLLVWFKNIAFLIFHVIVSLY